MSWGKGKIEDTATHTQDEDTGTNTGLVHHHVTFAGLGWLRAVC